MREIFFFCLTGELILRNDSSPCGWLLMVLYHIAVSHVSPNCLPLSSILRITSQVPHARLLQISLNWPKPLQLRFSNTSSTSWFKKNKLTRRNQVSHSKEVTQPLQSSYFYPLNYVTDPTASQSIEISSWTTLYNPSHINSLRTAE